MKSKIILILILLLVGLFARPFFRNWNHNRSAPEPLYVKTFGEASEAVLLLHGLSGTGNYWDPLVGELEKNYQVIVPDLLGFGKSPWPKIDYTIDDHLRRLIEVLPQKPLIVIGHSMGSLLAYELAKKRPDLVKQLILLAPTSLSSRAELKTLLGKESTVQSVMALDSWVAPALCHIHEVLGEWSFYLFRPLVNSTVPDSVVRSATFHRWESYNGSLENVVLKSQALDFDSSLTDISFLVGSSDLYSKNEVLGKKYPNVFIIEGDHNFFWQNQKETMSVIFSRMSERGSNP